MPACVCVCVCVSVSLSVCLLPLFLRHGKFKHWTEGTNGFDALCCTLLILLHDKRCIRRHYLLIATISGAVSASLSSFFDD